MAKHAARSAGSHPRRWWAAVPIVVSGLALFIAFGGSAIAKGLIHSADIAAGAVTSKTIRNGGIMPSDLNASTRESLRGAQGPQGGTGATGLSGANGANGVDGTDGIDGIDGTDGIDGIDGTIAPLFSTNGLTPLPTGPLPTTVISLAVPAGNYVVLAKSQLSHTGAGDSIDCTLKAGAATIDQVSMKTLPALAAIPMSLQAVTTTASSTQLSLECHVQVANGSANFSSLIAIPTG